MKRTIIILATILFTIINMNTNYCIEAGEELYAEHSIKREIIKHKRSEDLKSIKYGTYNKK